MSCDLFTSRVVGLAERHSLEHRVRGVFQIVSKSRVGEGEDAHSLVFMELEVVTTCLGVAEVNAPY